MEKSKLGTGKVNINIYGSLQYPYQVVFGLWNIPRCSEVRGISQGEIKRIQVNPLLSGIMELHMEWKAREHRIGAYFTLGKFRHIHHCLVHRLFTLCINGAVDGAIKHRIGAYFTFGTSDKLTKSLPQELNALDVLTTDCSIKNTALTTNKTFSLNASSHFQPKDV